MEDRIHMSVQHLREELNWVKEIIETTTIPGVPVDMSKTTPSPLSGNSNYSDFVKKNNFTLDQRFVFALAVAPHFSPGFLDTFMKKNPDTDDYFSEVGGKKAKGSRGFIPTGETAVFLLCRRNLERRIDIMSLFDADGIFVKNHIVSLGNVETGEPQFSGSLIVSPDIIDQIIYGKKSNPVFGIEFPAKRMHTEMTWNDLVLAPNTLNQIDELRIWLKYRKEMMEGMEMQKKVKPGYKVLFYGSPGTGKTLAACLLGKENKREVYRVDLSMVVSKYIGETEKNLAKIFDKAEHSDWILFFDEADALFGARTKVESSHDRYANQEVSYLLQRIEDYNGLVILASNLKNNIDSAFIRRFQAIIHFPLPKADERIRLWQKSFSQKIVLEEDIILQQIAQDYELSGSHIINIASHCTLHAIANGNEIVTKKMLRDGIVRELAKEGRTL